MKCYHLLLCLLAGLEQLRHCTSLQTLDISDIPVKGSFVSTLTSLRSLTARVCSLEIVGDRDYEERDYEDSDYEDRGIEVLFGDNDDALAGLTNLTALDIGGNNVAAGTPHLHTQCWHKAPLAL